MPIFTTINTVSYTHLIFMDEPNEHEIITLAEKIGLSSGDLNKYPTELSGGMAKRVAFLRLLPVSYTHLDVYKRQDCGWRTNRTCCMLNNSQQN